jgi:hypothetical protein
MSSIREAYLRAHNGCTMILAIGERHHPVRPQVPLRNAAASPCRKHVGDWQDLRVILSLYCGDENHCLVPRRTELTRFGNAIDRGEELIQSQIRHLMRLRPLGYPLLKVAVSRVKNHNAS